MVVNVLNMFETSYFVFAETHTLALSRCYPVNIVLFCFCYMGRLLVGLVIGERLDVLTFITLTYQPHCDINCHCRYILKHFSWRQVCEAYSRENVCKLVIDYQCLQYVQCKHVKWELFRTHANKFLMFYIPLHVVCSEIGSFLNCDAILIYIFPYTG